jgi:HlyD family secretion protein
VIYKNVADEVRAVGNLQARQRVTLSAEVAGSVTHIKVEEGQQVQAGELLASIDPRGYSLEVNRLEADLSAAIKSIEKAQKGLRQEEKDQLTAGVASAQSDLELAQKNIARVTDLVQQKVLSQSELDRETNNLRQAQENLRVQQSALSASTQARIEDIETFQLQAEAIRQQLGTARLQLAKVDIKAPFDGVVIMKSVEKGTYVKSGDPILEMIGSSTLKAVLELPQAYRNSLGKLRSANFFVKDLGIHFKRENITPEWVRAIPDADIFSGGVQLQIDLPAAPKSLFPGLTLESQLNFGVRKNVLHVPAVALVITEKGKVVYIRKDGVAHLVPVKAEKERDGLVEIVDFTHQLNSKVELILRGSGAVFPGASVFPIDPNPKTHVEKDSAKEFKGKETDSKKPSNLKS